eukprot:tig00021098_g18197.t1
MNGMELDGERDAPTRALPLELLASFMSWLDVPERARLARVCRRWRAATTEEPRSTELALTVAADVWDGDAQAALCEAREAWGRRRRARLERGNPEDPQEATPGDWERLASELARLERLDRRTLSCAEAAAALRRPVCAGAAARGGPRRLASLALHCAGERAGEAAAAAAAALAGLPLSSALPELRELRLLDGPKLADLALPLGGLGHPLLEVLHAAASLAADSSEAALRALPSLRFLPAVSLRRLESPAGADAPLLGLARAGVRLRGIDVGVEAPEPPAPAAAAPVLSAAAAAALESILRPDDAPAGGGGGEWRGYRAFLSLTGVAHPGAWSPAAFPGLDSYCQALSAVGRPMLHWIVRHPTLRRVELQCDLLDGLALPEAVRVVGAVREGVRVMIYEPPGGYPEADLCEAFDALVGSPDLMKRVTLYCGDSGALPGVARAATRLLEALKRAGLPNPWFKRG